MEKYLLAGMESERLIFDRASEAHYAQWLPFHENISARVHWKADFGTPDEECQKWYERQNHRYTHGLGGLNALFEKDSKRLIGHCGLLVQTVDDQEELEIGYSLLPEFWGMGYATEAARTCRDYAFENNFRSSLISIISLTNTPSMNVATKNGMSIEKQTVYSDNDVNIFRITRNEWDSIKRSF